MNENTPLENENTSIDKEPASVESENAPAEVENVSASGPEPEELSAEPAGEEIPVTEPETPSEPETVLTEDTAFGTFSEPVTASAVPEQQPEQPKPQKSRKNGALLSVAVMCSVLCLICAVTALVLSLHNNDRGAFSMPTVYTPDYEYTSTITPENAVLLDKAGVAKKVLPSVVMIETEITNQFNQTGTGLGTGFVFTADGLIITNHHVIDGAKKITVTLYDGRQFSAETVGSDSSNDVAVIRIEATDLVPVEIGDASKLVVGEDVVAIGNPYEASLAFTTTYGAVSAIRNGYHFSNLGTIIDVIQHDAAINSGNSGGPLVNMYGQVVGINSVKITGYDNLGFAININSVMHIIEDIINVGSVQRPTLGITCSTETNIGGVYVAEVNEKSAAEKAGVQVGDIITKFDGVRVKSTEELIAALGKHSAGDECTLTILRDVESMTLTVILDEAY